MGRPRKKIGERKFPIGVSVQHKYKIALEAYMLNSQHPSVSAAVAEIIEEWYERNKDDLEGDIKLLQTLAEQNEIKKVPIHNPFRTTPPMKR